MKFFKAISLTFSSQIISVVLTLVLTIVIARVLGSDGKGIYSLTILIPSIIILLGDFGISISNIYFGGKKIHEWEKLVSNSVVTAIVLGVVFGLGFLGVYYGFRPEAFNDILPLAIVYATLTIPFGIANNLLNAVLLGQEKIKEYNILQLSKIGMLTGFTLFVLYVMRGGVLDITITWALAQALTTLLTVIIISRTVRIRLSFHPGIFIDSVKFGIQVYLVNVIQFLNYRIDMFIIAHFVNTAAVGYYSVSVGIAEALWYLPGAVGTVIISITPGMSTSELNKSTPRICRITVFLTFLLTAVIAALSRILIELLYTEEFLPAVEPLLYLCPGIITFSICKVLSNEITMRGKPIVNTIAASIALVVNIILNVLLIPRMGISGAALASSISYTLTAAIVLAVFLRISENRFVDTVLIKKNDITEIISFVKRRVREAR